MALRFQTPFSMNGPSGQWLALTAGGAITGQDPMKNVVVASSSAFMLGTCTAGASAVDAGWFWFEAGRHNLGVVDFTKITVRGVSGSGVSMFCCHWDQGDWGPEGN